MYGSFGTVRAPCDRPASGGKDGIPRRANEPLARVADAEHTIGRDPHSRPPRVEEEHRPDGGRRVAVQDRDVEDRVEGALVVEQPAGATSVSHTQGNRSGNGQVVITW